MLWKTTIDGLGGLGSYGFPCTCLLAIDITFDWNGPIFCERPRCKTISDKQSFRASANIPLLILYGWWCWHTTYSPVRQHHQLQRNKFPQNGLVMVAIICRLLCFYFCFFFWNVVLLLPCVNWLALPVNTCTEIFSLWWRWQWWVPWMSQSSWTVQCWLCHRLDVKLTV